MLAQVASCIRELPYSEADVELFADCEALEGLSATATAAVLQVRQAGRQTCIGPCLHEQQHQEELDSQAAAVMLGHSFDV